MAVSVEQRKQTRVSSVVAIMDLTWLDTTEEEEEEDFYLSHIGNIYRNLH